MIKIMKLYGIYSREELMALNYQKIKEELVMAGVRPHLIVFYSIEVGLQSRRCTDISLDNKLEIRKILSI